MLSLQKNASMPHKPPHELYFDYLLEREGLHLLELGPALGLYKHEQGGLIYLHTVYVPESFRKQGWGSQIAAHVLSLSQNGITTSVAPAAYGSSESLAACLASGFEVMSSDSNLIYLYKPKEKV